MRGEGQEVLLVLHARVIREFKDVVFEDVVFDSNRFDIDVTIKAIDNRVTKLLLSNTTSQNTTSLNSRVILSFQQPTFQKLT